MRSKKTNIYKYVDGSRAIIYNIEDITIINIVRGLLPMTLFNCMYMSILLDTVERANKNMKDNMPFTYYMDDNSTWEYWSPDKWESLIKKSDKLFPYAFSVLVHSLIIEIRSDTISGHHRYNCAGTLNMAYHRMGILPE